MKKVFLLLVVLISSSWGFFAHKQINRLAIFTLPPAMSGFYKHHIDYLTESAVNPDKRRYAVVTEAPRHYIDLEDYGDSAIYKLPRYYHEAVEKFGEDSLLQKGILPWQLYRSYFQLKEAFLLKDPELILRISADLGHYVADAHVPLHTTRNYDGQLTDQLGIHGFWESRLPELFYNDYDFFVGKAVYIHNVQLEAWRIIERTNQALDSVLMLEKIVAQRSSDIKFNFETKGKQTMKVFSEEYSRQYHHILSGMIERQMRSSIKMTGSLWYTAWVDAGQPDLKMLINYKPSEEELTKRKNELLLWKEKTVKTREHENEEN